MLWMQHGEFGYLRLKILITVRTSQMHEVSQKLISKSIDNKNASRHCDYTDDFYFNHPDWSWNWSCLFWCVYLCVVSFQHYSLDLNPQLTGCSVISGCSPEQFFFSLLLLKICCSTRERKGGNARQHSKIQILFHVPTQDLVSEILLFIAPHNKIIFSPRS